MSDLNKQVCRKLGWKEIDKRYKSVFGERSEKWWIKPDGTATTETPPDYPHDLNACFRDLVPRMGECWRLVRHVDGTHEMCVPFLGIGGHLSPTPAECICRAFVAMKEG